MLTPYEILIRFNVEGAFQGASIKHWDSDRGTETAPEDLGDVSDPRFQAVAGTALTAANTQVAELQAQLATAQADAQDVPGLRDRISQLEAELEGYRNPPQPSRNYKGLYKALIGEEGISLFLHIRYIAGIDKDVNLAYVDTMSALVVGMLELPETDEQLQSCINVLFASISNTGGFSQAEIELMRSLLDKYGFSSIVFPLGV